MSLITLTTDFGLADAYVGIMKGVILGIAPGVTLVDLTHEIGPQDVRHAAYAVSQAAPYFPPGTVHLVVVDPGVGSKRRALVVDSGGARYVAPDNGVLSYPLMQTGAQAYELTESQYWLPDVSRTFHGRDVFAPVAAHLARGTPPEKMGHRIFDAVRLPLDAPVRHPDGHISGQVVYADRFGNLITDIPADWVGPESESGSWHCEVDGQRIARLSTAYSEVLQGELLALISSAGTLEIAVREGSAAQLLGIGTGAPVRVYPTQ